MSSANLWSSFLVSPNTITSPANHTCANYSAMISKPRPFQSITLIVSSKAMDLIIVTLSDLSLNVNIFKLRMQLELPCGIYF